MSKKSLVKTHDDMLVDLINEYRRKHGACRMEDVMEWIWANDLVDKPKVNPKAILTKKLKQAARRKKFRDAQGRTVRELIAAKIEREDARGQKYIDVIWDHIHEMSLSHALTAYTQCDEIIDKQCKSATRNVVSSLENNPNLAGYEDQFVFRFMREAAVEETVEEISEPLIPPNKSDESGGPNLPR